MFFRLVSKVGREMRLNKFRLVVSKKKATRPAFFPKRFFFLSETQPSVLVNTSQHYSVSDMISIDISVIRCH